MKTDTIAAIATAMSNSGIGIIRVSGDESIKIVDSIYRDKNHNKVLANFKSNTIHYGFIFDGEEIVDEVMVSVMNLSKAVAFSHNRNYVIPEDVKEIFVQAVSHRITLKKEYKGKVASESLMKNILSTTVMPGVQNA